MADVTLTVVTDPVCTWCWGSEPVLRRVTETYRDQVEIEYVMGGLVEDFGTFRDPANGITEPRDVAPHWEEAAARHGMPVDASVWTENPPDSTYPACRAYEAAALVAPDRADRYLRRLRAAVAAEGRDVSDRVVLRNLAAEVGIDVGAFDDALSDGRAERAFEADRAFARRHGARAFPSYRVEAGGDEQWFHGFTRFEAFADAFRSVAPDLTERDPRSLEAFARHYGRVATREVAEVYEMEDGKAIQVLRCLADDGVVSGRKYGSGYLWTVADEADHEAATGSPIDRVEIRDQDGRAMGACTVDGDCAPDAGGG